MNVVIAKIGKSIKFNPETWGGTGGPNEAPLFFQNIARLNPQNTYYIIGKTDFSRLDSELKREVCPNGNIIDIWSEFQKGQEAISYPLEYFKKHNVAIDCGLIYAGSVAAVNQPNLVYKKGKDEFVGVLETYKNYAAPIVKYLNESKIKWITLCPDPRYVPLQAEDILNTESISLAMKDETKTFQRMKSFDDQDSYVEHTINCKYSGIETVFLMDKQVQKDLTKYTKDMKMVIFHNENQVSKKDELNRGVVVTNYILNQFPYAEIYGKWNEKWAENDKRFKGLLKFAELQDLLPRVKYTFMIPIDKDTVSMKFWECLCYNIIPFMHEYYDTSGYLTKQGCPDFIRISSPEDLKNKIEYLENNPDEYEKLVKQLRNMLLQEYIDGTHLNSVVNNSIKELDTL